MNAQGTWGRCTFPHPSHPWSCPGGEVANCRRWYSCDMREKQSRGDVYQTDDGVTALCSRRLDYGQSREITLVRTTNNVVIRQVVHNPWAMLTTLKACGLTCILAPLVLLHLVFLDQESMSTPPK